MWKLLRVYIMVLRDIQQLQLNINRLVSQLMQGTNISLLQHRTVVIYQINGCQSAQRL